MAHPAGLIARSTALAAALLVGCGSENTVPTTPSTTGGTTDIRGTWAQVGGDTRVWVLDQGGIQGSGTASFSQQSHPSVGAVSGTGGVLGAVILGSFRFAETYESVTIPSRPSPNYCYIDTEGQLALSGNLVLSHFVPADDPAVTDQMWIDTAQTNFRGTVVVGRDLLEI